MTREEIILQLLISLNQGNCSYANQRVDIAIEQYNQLVEKSVIEDERKG